MASTPWEYFISPTYQSKTEHGQDLAVPSVYVRERILLEYLRKVAKRFSCPWEYLLWIAREELGERGGRPHWHILVAGLNHVAGRGIVPSPNIASDTHRLVNIWRTCGRSAGRIDVRAYDARLSGVDYITKGLGFLNWDPSEANAYEVSKFEDTRQGRKLILAPAWVRYVSMRSRNRRHLKAQDVKRRARDRSNPGALKSPVNHVRPTQPDKYEGKSQHAW